MIAAHHADAFHKIREIIEQHIVEPLSYAQLCKRVRISEDILLYGYRELFNTSPYQYYLYCKFAEIEKLLRHTDDTLSTISNAMGYEHVSSFVRAFKKRYDCTPGEWRRNYE